MTTSISRCKAAVALSTVLLGGIATADGPAPSGLREKLLQTQLKSRFAKADVNHDGHLTREEAQKEMPRVYEHFDEIDADKKGFLTLEQIQAFLASRSKQVQTPSQPSASTAPPSGGKAQ